MRKVSAQSGKFLESLESFQTLWAVSSQSRVVEVGSLLARAKMPSKNFVGRVFAIFATNTSFLRVIANLQNQFSIILAQRLPNSA